MSDARDIAAEVAYMAKHPRMFTKKDMTLKLAEAAKAIEALRAQVGIRAGDWHESTDGDPAGCQSALKP